MAPRSFGFGPRAIPGSLGATFRINRPRRCGICIGLSEPLAVGRTEQNAGHGGAQIESTWRVSPTEIIRATG